MLALVNVDVVSSGVVLRGKTIIVRDNVIDSIVESTHAIPEGAQIINFAGSLALPGLIDLQIYGAGGSLFGGNPTTDALDVMAAELSAQGVTGFLATIATNTDEIVNQGLEAVKAQRKQIIGNCWGLHLEGPYLSPAKRGAHPENLIQTATLAKVESLVTAAQGCVRMMTVAPERVSVDVLSYLSDSGIVLSAGHSNATYEEGLNFLHNPITTVTHLFNAMPALHHRDLGFTLAVLEKRPYASIVADGIHVAFPMVRLAKKHLGDRLFLITDAVTATLDGIYPHILQNGDRYVMPDGTLSGSALTLMKAMHNCVQHCDIPLEEAVNMASLYPARVLGVDHKKGKLEAAYDADICIMSADFRPVATFIGGKLVFLAK